MTLAAAALYTMFLWWFSTGVILWLDRLPRSTYRWSLLAGTLVAAASLYGLSVSMKNASPVGAVIAFTCALGLWSWHELSFLMGFVTGPRNSRCPPEAKGWRRFALATSTLIYHEIALMLTAGVVVAITWREPNQIGCWTFLILLASRLSAKLNLFLGVPNFSEAFFPDHLRYLTSYLRKRAMNALFPWSIAAGLALTGLAGWRALDPYAGQFETVGFSLVFVLTALAVLEHAFMLLPLPDTALWRWAMPAPAKSDGAS